ncbi:hypothetical protein [Afipia carboxidovorans]|uniref:hypothetical protein n=1 Tax=Afipia carboxidovorans TaxID=40137 RepID=UPI00308D8758|nr:hypothetical protein CRBSH125_35280 [Afipia carboxidovorans]
MANFVDRAWMSVAGTPGTGDITLGAPVAGNQSFSDAGVTDGVPFSYVAVDGNDFEIGDGEAATSVSVWKRTAVSRSCVSGVVGTSKLNLSSAAQIFLTARASDLVDSWGQQPIGVPIPLLDSIVGVAQPPTDRSYRYIKLTASDAYNTGVLTSESVTGSAPLVVATAVISLSGSPLNGQTVNLINTERRVLRGGSAGAVENDQMQQITGDIDTSIHATTTTPLLISPHGAISQGPAVLHSSVSLAGPATITSGFTFNSANSPGARTGTETRGKNIGATFFMRVR